MHVDQIYPHDHTHSYYMCTKPLHRNTHQHHWHNYLHDVATSLWNICTRNQATWFPMHTAIHFRKQPMCSHSHLQINVKSKHVLACNMHTYEHEIKFMIDMHKQTRRYTNNMIPRNTYTHIHDTHRQLPRVLVDNARHTNPRQTHCHTHATHMTHKHDTGAHTYM